MRKFSSVFQSINAYILNLNTNQSYKKLRDIRAKLRKNNQKITGIKLAQALSHYSERGISYVKDIINMIKFNRLEEV